MTEKYTSYLLGLPCGGTTIPSKVLDNVGGSFMVSEPLFMLFQQEATLSTTKERYDKREQRREEGLFELENTNMPNGLAINSMDTIGNDIRAFVDTNDEFTIGGVKETCNSRMNYIFEKLRKDDFDLRIYHFRDPLANYNSWKKKDWDPYYRDAQNFVDSYKKLYALAMNDKEGVITTHEKFCADPLAITNKMLFGILTIDQLPQLPGVKKTKWGNKNAISSTRVKPADMDYSQLTKNEVAKAESELRELYKKVSEAT